MWQVLCYLVRIELGDVNNELEFSKNSQSRFSNNGGEENVASATTPSIGTKVLFHIPFGNTFALERLR